MPRPLTPPPERRAFGRRETLIHAIVKVAGRPPEPCIVRNVSEHGALLELPADLELPDQFRLLIDARNVDVLCHPRRRNGNQLGVEFAEHPPAPIKPRPVAASAHPQLSQPLADPQVAPQPVPKTPGANPILSPGPFATIEQGDDVRRQLGLV